MQEIQKQEYLKDVFLMSFSINSKALIVLSTTEKFGLFNVLILPLDDTFMEENLKFTIRIEEESFPC